MREKVQIVALIGRAHPESDTGVSTPAVFGVQITDTSVLIADRSSGLFGTEDGCDFRRCDSGLLSSSEQQVKGMNMRSDPDPPNH